MDARDAEDVTESPTGRRRAEIRVVFVDDEPDVLELGREYLAAACDERFDVTTTTRPADVLELVDGGEVDCIVSAYDMPEMDGLDLLRQVKERDVHLPFVLFTARGSEEVASEAISAGITDYLQKEFTRDQFELLANRIHNAVEHYRMLCGHAQRTALLTDVANNISESVFVVTDDSELLYSSDVIEDIYGLPTETFEEDPLAFLEYVHPDDRPRIDATIEQLEAAHEAGTWDEEYQVEYRFDHPERGWRWIRASLNPVVDDDEATVRLVGTATDVTDEKEAVGDLEASEERFRSIAELSDDAIYRVDLEGTVTYASPAIEELLGYAPDAIVGEQFLDFVAPDDREEAVAAFTAGLEGERRTQVEFDLQHAEGHTVAVETNQSMIREDGEVVGVQGVARDVTDRKERERDLEQYERIVETVPDGVFVLDEEGRIVAANEQAATLAGHDPQKYDLPTPPVTELENEGVASDEAIARYTAAVEELLASEADQTMYRLPLAVDGDQRVLEMHVGLRSTEDEFRGTVGVVRDITERVQYERELERQNERLEQFASTVSHDLRNPLNVATGTLELAREDCDSPHLETIAESHERMNALIDDILALARQGQAVDDPEPVALAAACRRAWQAVKTADATLTVEEGLGELEADESRLRQLLENLFRNSVEHGSTGSRTQSDDSVEHGSTGSRTQSDDSVEHGGDGVSVTVGPLAQGEGFHVSDDGPGIPPGQREQVFEQGFTTAQSTGFGLAIVEEIAEAHDWSVAVGESAEGGARFELRRRPVRG
ncbi:MAG: PAS domain S-box protein [Haloarculaceae archaeon]